MTQALKFAAMGAGVVTPTYVDDVFSTWLYSGSTGTQTIQNGIDLGTNGGMVWVKCRGTASTDHVICHQAAAGVAPQTNAGFLASNSTAARVAIGYGPYAFNTNGFDVYDDAGIGNSNLSGRSYASWTFRKSPKFFDVVTYTGNGSNRDIAHSLGVAPGCIMVKRTDTSSDWQVYHRSLGSVARLRLNSTAGQSSDSTFWNSTDPTSSVFSLGTNADVNANGGTYVAYLFAHDTDTVDGLIQCGSVTLDGSANASVTLGWEPQWLLIKRTNGAGSWYMLDSLRGFTNKSSTTGRVSLLSDSSAAEGEQAPNGPSPTATGVDVTNWLAASAQLVYIAIRRPNKPPTVGTQVFGLATSTAAVNASTPKTLAIPAPDLWLDTLTSGSARYWLPRLTGWGNLQSEVTSGETAASSYNFQQTAQDKLLPGSSWWSAAQAQISWFFKRAPGFFDVVCDTGTGSTKTVSHSLGVAPELIIRKSRSAGTNAWHVRHSGLSAGDYLVLSSNAAKANNSNRFTNTAPTTSVFSVGINAEVNTNGDNYINYLFATLAGISKVGTYTGNGAVGQTINCGFTTGARFVMIKRTDSTGDWYVWDTARGIIAGNDPHLNLNDAVADVTGDDTIDPDNSGFIVNQRSATNVNVNAATYIFLAVA